jgi:hypothetical protein
MWAFDGDTEALSKLTHTANVIDMRVRDKDFFDVRAGFIHALENSFKVTTRIDDGGLVGLLAHKN